MMLLVLIAFLALTSVMCMPSSVKVIANVRGKKYDVIADTVEEFCSQVEGLAGIEAKAQSVLFRGKVLSPSDKLEDIGVSAGDILNVVKGRKRQPSFVKQEESTARPLTSTPTAPVDALDADKSETQKAQNAAAVNTMNAILDDIETHFAPEKLEQSRQQVLKNLDQYEKMMPGFRAQAEEIASDPDKWMEAMMKAKESMIKLKDMRDTANLNPEDLFPGAGSGSSSLAPSSPDNSVDDIGEDDGEAE